MTAAKRTTELFSASDTPPNWPPPFHGESWTHTTSGIRYLWSEIAKVWVEEGGTEAFPADPTPGERHNHGDQQWEWNGVGWAKVRPLKLNADEDLETEKRLVVPAITLDGEDLATKLGDSESGLQGQIDSKTEIATQEEAEAGTEDLHKMTPQRTAQAIAVLVPKANQYDMEAATSEDAFATPAAMQFHPGVAKAEIHAGFVPDQHAGNLSSVNLSTNVITWSVDLTYNTGDLILAWMNSVVSCYWPIPATSDGPTLYNIRKTGTRTFTLHLTKADALAGTNIFDLTSAGANYGNCVMARYVIAETEGFNCSVAPIIDGGGLHLLPTVVNLDQSFVDTNYLVVLSDPETMLPLVSKTVNSLAIDREMVTNGSIENSLILIDPVVVALAAFGHFA